MESIILYYDVKTVDLTHVYITFHKLTINYSVTDWHRNNSQKAISLFDLIGIGKGELVMWKFTCH